ncbi:MAG TPA: hypothetical protein VM012_00010 [Flavitalea sp.]|nr:hypothetical protein [Flavitalea sp.]
MAISQSAPPIEWQKCLGGSNSDYSYSIDQTTDGGYIVAGVSRSNNGDVSGNHGERDFWVVKLNSIGNLQWQKSFGGSGFDFAYSVQQTTDDGYIVAGITISNNGDVSGNHGSVDYWVVKLNSMGDLQWQKCLGGTDDEYAYSIRQTTDEGYIVAGLTASVDGDVSGNHGSLDCWLVKLNATGEIQWQKCLGGSSGEQFNSIQQTLDGGYIIAGFTNSNDGDVNGLYGFSDYWVVKLNGLGELQWQKCLGGTMWEEAYSIQQCSDGGFILAGYSGSTDGDVNCNPEHSGYWVVKLNGTGFLEWQKCFGGTWGGNARSIQQTTEGGYIVAGYTYSNDGDVNGNHGELDSWIVKLNATGDLEWQKCLGGTIDEYAFSIQQTADGGYIVAGLTSSNDGDVSGNHGDTDFWIVKLFGCGRVVQNTNDTGDGSLRKVINSACDGAFISFTLPSMSQITLTSGEITIDKNLTLSGPGINQLIISGNNNSRIFNLLPGRSLRIENLSLKNTAALSNGGALLVKGNLTLKNVLLENNFENGVHKSMTLLSTGSFISIGQVDIKQ